VSVVLEGALCHLLADVSHGGGGRVEDDTEAGGAKGRTRRQQLPRAPQPHHRPLRPRGHQRREEGGDGGGREWRSVGKEAKEGGAAGTRAAALRAQPLQESQQRGLVRAALQRHRPRALRRRGRLRQTKGKKPQIYTQVLELGMCCAINKNSDTIFINVDVRI
jgi:hypothetical protein